MSETYQAFYVNEVRALQITVNDQDGQPFAADTAYATVKDENDTEVVAEAVASVIGNTVQTLIGTVTTATAGQYKIIWRLVKSGYTYYHVTELEVTEL